MDCEKCKHEKCKHFKELMNNEYTCKYIEDGSTGFHSDSTDTAENCEYYEEKELEA